MSFDFPLFQLISDPIGQKAKQVASNQCAGALLLLPPPHSSGITLEQQSEFKTPKGIANVRLRISGMPFTTPPEKPQPLAPRQTRAGQPPKPSALKQNNEAEAEEAMDLDGEPVEGEWLGSVDQ